MFELRPFSLESGCLLPSLPLDVSYDKTSGIGFICDLNDNIEAPWPSTSSIPVGSCNECMVTNLNPPFQMHAVCTWVRFYFIFWNYCFFFNFQKVFTLLYKSLSVDYLTRWTAASKIPSRPTATPSQAAAGKDNIWRYS